MPSNGEQTGQIPDSYAAHGFEHRARTRVSPQFTTPIGSERPTIDSLPIRAVVRSIAPKLRSFMTQIRAVAFDVDGVLTDGGFWWGADGEEFKRFCFADVMGISIGRKAGLFFALISGEDTPLLDRFAAKLGISDVARACKDKSQALRGFATRCDVSLRETCYMGDDVNDIPAMQIAGIAAAPANARPEALRFATFVSKNDGGNGAVRELIDAIIAGDVRPSDAIGH